MKRIFIVLFFLILMLCSCGKKEELLDYQKHPFEGEFEIIQNDFTYTVHMSGDSWDGEVERAFAAEFLAPKELKGIKISRENGRVYFSLGGIEFEENAESPVSLCGFTEYFELKASPTEFLKEKEKTTAHLVSEKGENVKITYLGNGSPTLIEGEEMTIKVISYKVKK